MGVLTIISLIFAGQTVGALTGLIWKPGEKFLRLSLSFAASMMVGISLLQLVPEALGLVSAEVAVAAFFSGVLIMSAINWVIPHMHPGFGRMDSLQKTALMLTVGIALHNLPEGLAIGSGFAVTGSLGLVVALGIAVQDVPENIATIIPLYAVTKSRVKSFAITSLTIMFELAGFIVAYFILKDVSPGMLGGSLAMAAGFMTHISFHELIPEARIRECPAASAASILLGLACVMLTGLLH